VGQTLNADCDYCSIAKQYAEHVASGEIPACKWVRSACQRQLDDLDREDWRWHFDNERASKICSFVELLPHIKGRWKTRNIVLEPWQCFLLTTIFGWVDADGFRRFRKALTVIPRKNTKTTIAAAVALFLLGVDGEPGAEVVSAATTKDQAKLCWEVGKRMVERSTGFRDRFGVEALSHSIVVEAAASSFKPLSRDADTLEGLNPHGWIVDELHAHKTREVFDVLDEATGARRQSLGFLISTEGENSTGIFAEQRAYGEQILAGRHEDDSYFVIIYTIDPEDDWTDPASWRKANPNLGVSVFEDDLATRCRQAQKNTESQSSFLTKRLNVRVGAGNAYFNLLAWEHRCKDEALAIEDFYGQPCQIFLDLASKSDACAKVQLFERQGKRYVFGKYYLPEDSLEKGNPNYDLYRGWSDADWITITPGSATDYEFIERDLMFDVQNFQVLNVCYDPFQATQFATRMYSSGVPMQEYGMSVRNFSEPMKQLAADIVSGQIKHNGDPVLAWMIGNVTAKVDAKENVFPRKARPENKIDGAVALIGAYGKAGMELNQSGAYDDPLKVVI
jgi:phage terminase large subunit-like protein